VAKNAKHQRLTAIDLQNLAMGSCNDERRSRRGSKERAGKFVRVYRNLQMFFFVYVYRRAQLSGSALYILNSSWDLNGLFFHIKEIEID